MIWSCLPFCFSQQMTSEQDSLDQYQPLCSFLAPKAHPLYGQKCLLQITRGASRDTAGHSWTRHCSGRQRSSSGRASAGTHCSDEHLRWPSRRTLGQEDRVSVPAHLQDFCQWSTFICNFLSDGTDAGVRECRSLLFLLQQEGTNSRSQVED